MVIPSGPAFYVNMNGLKDFIAGWMADQKWKQLSNNNGMAQGGVKFVDWLWRIKRLMKERKMPSVWQESR